MAFKSFFFFFFSKSWQSLEKRFFFFQRAVNHSVKLALKKKRKRLVLHHCVIQSKQHLSNLEKRQQRSVITCRPRRWERARPPASSTWTPCDPQKLTCYNFKFRVKLKRVCFSFFNSKQQVTSKLKERSLKEKYKKKKKGQTPPTPVSPCWAQSATSIGLEMKIHSEWLSSLLRPVLTFASDPAGWHHRRNVSHFFMQNKGLASSRKNKMNCQSWIIQLKLCDLCDFFLFFFLFYLFGLFKVCPGLKQLIYIYKKIHFLHLLFFRIFFFFFWG